MLKNSEDITGKTKETMEQLKIKELPPPFGGTPSINRGRVQLLFIFGKSHLKASSSVYRGGGSEADGGVQSKNLKFKISMALKIADKEFTSRLFTGTG